MRRLRGSRTAACKAGTLVAAYSHQGNTAVRRGVELLKIPPNTLAWRILDSDGQLELLGENALWMEISTMTVQLWTHCRAATMQAGAAQAYGLIEDAAIAVEGERLAWVGPMSELPADLARAQRSDLRLRAARSSPPA